MTRKRYTLYRISYIILIYNIYTSTRILYLLYVLGAIYSIIFCFSSLGGKKKHYLIFKCKLTVE